MAENKKLLFINTLYAPHIGGGAEIILQEQVEGLQSRGFHVSVLTTGPNKGLNIDTINKIKIYRAGLKNLYWHFTKKKYNKFLRLVWHIKDSYNRPMRKYVREVIAKEKPDVIICHNLTGWSISAWKEINKAGIPIIQVLHDLYLLCPGSNMFKNGKACDIQCTNCKLFRTKHSEASSQVNALVGVSRYVLNKFNSAGYFKKTVKYVIHNAREIATSEPKRIHNSNSPLRIGYIGTLSEVKGVEWLIKEFLSININATLVIAGRGEDNYEEYLKRIGNNENISFLGYIGPDEFYPNIDVLVIPSVWPDTFPGVAYEAGAYHIPVIASEIGGLPEIIKNGVNGLLCDPNQPNSLGEALIKLSSDSELYNFLSANSRGAVSHLLSKERMFNEYIELINSF
jgi:glycosyltransferase involved in cell wall biosynthesis